MEALRTREATGLDPGSRTRERLLDAAENLFASRGFVGASVRDITATAGCNIAAVNYHFRGKQELYREVFRRRLAMMRERRLTSLKEAVEAQGERVTLEKVLRAFANAFLEPLVDDSKGRIVMELMSRELLDPHLPPQFFDAEMFLPVHQQLSHAIRLAEPGVGEVAVRMSIQSFVAQLAHLLHLRRYYGAVRETGVPTATLPEMVRHIVAFTSAGIRAYRKEPVT